MVKFLHNNSKADRIRLLPDTDGFEVLWPPLTDHIAAHAIVDGLTSAAKAVPQPISLWPSPMREAHLKK